MDTKIFILILALGLMWLVRELVNARLEHKQAIHRINHEHTTSAQYWERTYKYVKEQDEINKQILEKLDGIKKGA